MAAAPATSCELSRRSRPGSARCNRAPSAKSSCTTVVVAARVIEQFELAAGPAGRRPAATTGEVDGTQLGSADGSK